MLTVQYAKAQPGIKFNAVEPGFTATDLAGALDFRHLPADSTDIR